MRRSKLLVFGVLVISLASMNGCASINKGTAEQTAPAKVSSEELVLSTEGELPAGSSIGGIDVTLKLPAGVTVRTDKKGEPQTGVVVASGVAKGAMIASRYIPAEESTSAMVRSAFIKLEGFSTGEFATMNLDFSGNAPKVSDFSTTLVITDTDSKKLPGIKCVLSLKAK